MALFGDLMAQVANEQQAPRQGGLFADLLARIGAQSQTRPQGGGLMSQVAQQAGAQPSGNQGVAGGLMAQVADQVSAQPQASSMADMMGQGGGFGVAQPQSFSNMMPQGSGFGGASSQSPWAQLMGNMSAGGFGGVGSQDPVERFRQMFGRDPQSQQELAMIGGPAVSQGMG